MVQNYTKSRQSDVPDQVSWYRFGAVSRVGNLQTAFDLNYRFHRLYLSHSGRIAFHFKSIGKWKIREWCHFAKGLMPITTWLPQYSWKSNLLFDFLGGLMISVMSVPQSLRISMIQTNFPFRSRLWNACWSATESRTDHWYHRTARLRPLWYVKTRLSWRLRYRLTDGRSSCRELWKC